MESRTVLRRKFCHGISIHYAILQRVFPIFYDNFNTSRIQTLVRHKMLSLTRPFADSLFDGICMKFYGGFLTNF